MKKLLGIAFIGLFWCNISFTQEVKYSPSNLIRLGYILTHVTPTNNATVLIYTFEKKDVGEHYPNNAPSNIVSCHIALDKKQNRFSCYTVAD